MIVRDIISMARGLIADTSNTFYTDEEMMMWVNEGMYYLFQRLPLSALSNFQSSYTYIVSSEGDVELTLPVDFDRFVYAVLTSNDGIEYFITVSDRRYLGNEAIALYNRFEDYTLISDFWGDVWKIYDCPEGTITLYYIRRPEEMLDVHDTIPFPDDIATLTLPYYVASKAKEKDQDFQGSQVFQRDFEINLMRVIARYGDYITGLNQQISPDYRGDWE